MTFQLVCSNQNLLGKSALVLEDHPVSQGLLDSYLKAAGMRVTLCDHGQQAVELLGPADAPHFDVIITDLEMPVMNGYEFTTWLRNQARWMTTPLVGLTGHTFSQTRTHCLDLGMNDFIAKPVEAAVLCATLTDLLNGAAREPSEFAMPPALPALFMDHCAALPAKLRAFQEQNDEAAFGREIHSLISILALTGEQALHTAFREFEQGLHQQTLKPQEVLDQIDAWWPSLLIKYAELTQPATPTQEDTSP